MQLWKAFDSGGRKLKETWLNLMRNPSLKVIYEACSKSIVPLVGKITVIYLDV